MPAFKVPQALYRIPLLSRLLPKRHDILQDEDGEVMNDVEALMEETTVPTAAQKAEKKKAEEEKRKRSHLGYLLLMLPYLWPKKKYELKLRIVISLLLLIVSKVAVVLTPLAYKNAVDILAEPQTSIPFLLVSLYGIGRFSSTLFDNLRDTIFVKVSQNALQSAALKTFSHLHELSVSFHITRKTGTVLRAIDRGTQGISWITTFMLFNIAPILIEIALVCSVMISKYISWMAIITAATVAMYIAFTITVTEWRTKFRRQVNELDSQVNDKAVDSLLNYETVKYFNAEEHEIKRYGGVLQNYTKAQTKNQASLSFLNIGQAFIIAVGQLSLMLLSADQVAKGKMQVGDFVLVNTYIIQLYGPLNFLGTSYRMIKQSLIDMEKMFDLLDEVPDVKDKPDAIPLDKVEGEIAFENVKFSYPSNGNEVLKGVNFSVKPGKTVALVGPSGSGKSTISRLLYRFYDITDGKISVDGHDITEVRQKDLRRFIGIVPQDTVLFNDTIRYNIAYGRPDAEVTDEEVFTVAKMAGIHDKILTFPDGYNTIVGERGLRLSGGEKQRVSIARCLLKNPPIIILDEATSALDTHTEKEIQENLRTVFKGKTTTITLAHRLSTIVDADEILVVKNGEVVERGTHHELLAKEDGEYRKLWLKQLESKADKEVAEEQEDNGDAASPKLQP